MGGVIIGYALLEPVKVNGFIGVVGLVVVINIVPAKLGLC